MIEIVAAKTKEELELQIQILYQNSHVIEVKYVEKPFKSPFGGTFYIANVNLGE